MGKLTIINSGDAPVWTGTAAFWGRTVVLTTGHANSSRKGDDMHDADMQDVHDHRTYADSVRVLWTGDVRGDQMHIVAIDGIEGTASYAVHRYCEGCGAWHDDTNVPATPVVAALIAAGKLKL